MKKVIALILIAPFFLSCSGDDTYTKRCIATTKDGTQCKRDAEKGSSYCWQHKK